MKQVLFVCAGYEFPHGAFNFLLSMEKAAPLHIQGLFFSPMDYEAMATVSQLPVLAPYNRLREKEHRAVETNKEIFEKLCKDHYIRHKVIANDEQWSRELLRKESRFADLMLLSGELFYDDINIRQPNLFLREALRDAECPAVVTPEKFSECSHVFIAYDGSKESLTAIKQFCRLFPQYTELPTELVFIKHKHSDEIPEEIRLKDYARWYFDNISFSRVDSDGAQITAFIGDRPGAILVSGSFGRSSLSYLTKRSFSEEAIHEHKFPIFIAHD
jgi:hypothetical protein